MSLHGEWAVTMGRELLCPGCMGPELVMERQKYLVPVGNQDRLCGLLFRVLGYRSGGPGSIPVTTRKKKGSGPGTGPLSLVSTTEELLDRKVAAPV
jgi:hypothetical protein